MENKRYSIIKSTFPYYILQDRAQINQFCVMVRTGSGFSQQVSKWYFRQGNAINKYHSILADRTSKILNKEGI